MRQFHGKVQFNPKRHLKKGALGAGLVVAALGMLAPTGSAHAATISYSGSIVQYTIPSTGTYTIDAVGAAGANGYLYPGVGYAGGLGAEMVGTFTLTAGTTLDILVGGTGEGAYYGGSGGGGSFVVLDSTKSPLVVAGGGGGGGSYADTGAVMTGGNGLTTTSGGNSIGTNGAVQGNGGTGGSGGSLGIGYDGGYYDAGAGGGFSGNGASNTANASGGGKSYLNGGAGGAGYNAHSDDGGFGGGGGAGYYGAGGGGGYSGGAGSDATDISNSVGGGGGGSYLDSSGTLVSAASGVSTDDGNGLVTITPASVPEPASLALLGIGALALMGRRRRNRG